MTAPEIAHMRIARTLGHAVLLLAFTLVVIVFGNRFAHAHLQLLPGQAGEAWTWSGFHAIECNTTDCYRWSQPDARIFLYEVDGDHALLTLRMTAPPRDDRAPATLSISVAGHPASAFKVAPGWRRYQIIVPIQGTSDTLLHLQSVPFHPSGTDTRQLGVALSALDVRPLGGLTPWRAGFLLLLPLAGWWLMLATGTRPLLAFSVGLLLAALSGWAATAPFPSGFWLPTLGWPQGRLVPMLALLLAPLGIRWLYGHVPGAPWSGLALVVVALLALRLMNGVAAGLILLLIGTLLTIAHTQTPRTARLTALARQRGRNTDSAPDERSATPAMSGARGTGYAPAIPVLTGIRFFAALAVVLFHYQRLIPYPEPMQTFVEQGQASVGLFFILSGFILVYNYFEWFRADTIRYWEYARARFARIFPVYALALLLSTPLVLYYVLADPANNMELPGYELSWIANLLLIHVYFPSGQMQTLWNGPSWSVAAECFFYAIFPCFVSAVLSRFTRARVLLLLIIGLFGIELLAFMASVGALGWLFPEPEAFTLALVRIVHKSPFLRVWEFLIGAALGAIFLLSRTQPAKVHARLNNQRTRNVALALALLALLAIALMPTVAGISKPIGDALHWYVLYTPFFALIVITLAAGPTFVTRFLSHPWIVRLGEASYALYILHAIPRGIVPLVLPLGASRATTTWLALLAIAGSIIASLLVYTLVETPARKWLRGNRVQYDRSKIVTAPAGVEISKPA
jgi:peptidoglycan/LPS O-acetylase OafA/YrhL